MPSREDHRLPTGPRPEKVPDTFLLVSDGFCERRISLLGHYTRVGATYKGTRSANHTGCPDGGDGSLVPGVGVWKPPLLTTMDTSGEGLLPALCVGVAAQMADALPGRGHPGGDGFFPGEVVGRLLVADEVLFAAVHLIEEELVGIRLALQDIEADVAGLLTALAGVLEGGLEEGVALALRDVHRDADDVHGSHLPERSAIGSQRSEVRGQRSEVSGRRSARES